SRYLQMMLQHGLFHLHIIVIVVLEKVVVKAEVVVKMNEKVVRKCQIEREGGSGSGRVQRKSGSGSGRQDERGIGSESGSGQRESGGRSGLINQNEEERGGESGGHRRLVEGSGQTEEPRWDKG